ncbi:DUF2312 domain-containing protein [Pikeienuella sp. HZG-20]|uniref:DUF2312 domain-containing protein n=1 Tax=Paludibacillus litoralis TaxID=3133267 RepID=UPI0030EDD86F
MADDVLEGPGFSTTTVAADQLRSIVERIERLEEEKREIADQVKEVYAEAKGNGFDVKTLRTVISLRKKKAEEREEEEAMLDLYLHALGMVPEPAA